MASGALGLPYRLKLFVGFCRAGRDRPGNSSSVYNNVVRTHQPGAAHFYFHRTPRLPTYGEERVNSGYLRLCNAGKKGNYHAKTQSRKERRKRSLFINESYMTGRINSRQQRYKVSLRTLRFHELDAFNLRSEVSY